MSEIEIRKSFERYMCLLHPSVAGVASGDDLLYMSGNSYVLASTQRQYEAYRTELQEKLRQQREACAEAAEDAGYWLNDERIMPDDIGETVRNAKIDD